jgi:hypothetical protein
MLSYYLCIGLRIGISALVDNTFVYFFQLSILRVYLCCFILWAVKWIWALYMVIRKSLRDFQPLQYSSQDGHAEGESMSTEGETL